MSPAASSSCGGRCVWRTDSGTTEGREEDREVKASHEGVGGPSSVGGGQVRVECSQTQSARRVRGERGGCKGPGGEGPRSDDRCETVDDTVEGEGDVHAYDRRER